MVKTQNSFRLLYVSERFAAVWKLVGLAGVAGVLISGNPVDYQRKIEFAGHTWLVKEHNTKEGPGPNYFSDADSSAWVDDKGNLHLTIRKENEKWLCSEVICLTPLTLGTLEIEIKKTIRPGDPNCVLGFFTWLSGKVRDHKEIDIELSSWGKAKNKFNTQFVVQPARKKKNKDRFILQNTDNYLFRMDISKNKTEFSAIDQKNNKLVRRSILKSRIRDLEGVKARINFWLYKGIPPLTGTKQEVIISAFKFIPS